MKLAAEELNVMPQIGRDMLGTSAYFETEVNKIPPGWINLSAVAFNLLYPWTALCFTLTCLAKAGGSKMMIS